MCKIKPFIKLHPFITFVLDYRYIVIVLNVIEDHLFYFKVTLVLFDRKESYGNRGEKMP